MNVFSTYQEQLQDMISQGINAAEEQHKRLIDMPFEMAEKFESSLGTKANSSAFNVQSMRESFDSFNDTLFSQLRDMSNTMNEFTAQMVAQVEKNVAQSTEAFEKVKASA